MSGNKLPSAVGPNWIVPFGNGAASKLRLFCFPHTGAGASMYAAWARLLPATVQVCGVQLPGRENRLDEPLMTDVTLLIDRLTAGILPYLDRPFAFFGHSLGAVLAYEATLRLQASGGPRPERLFVSARLPPGVASPEPLLSEVPDPVFLSEMKRRYSTNAGGFWENRELVELFLPILRADMKLAESNRFTVDGRIECPMAAFGGTADRLSPDQLKLWQRHACGDFQLKLFPGGHDYVSNSPGPLVAALGEILLPPE